MNNPIYKALGGNRGNMMGDFQTFVKQMQGLDPNKEIQKLLQSGKITQTQLNQAQQMAQQMGLFKR